MTEYVRPRAPRLARSLITFCRDIVLSLSSPGVVMAAVWFWQSLSPSLLPRTWVMQGVLSGVSALIGYFLGWLLGRIAYLFGYRPHWPLTTMTALHGVLFALAVAYSFIVFGISAEQQEYHWEALNVSEPERFLYSGVVVITLAFCAVAVAVNRGVHALRRRLSRGGQRFLPRWLAAAISIGVVGFAVLTLANDVLYNGALTLANRSFAVADLRVDKDEPPPPTSALRTAGPGSRLDWAKLGAEGRRFLSDGPAAAQISAVSGRPAKEPIRLFVGRESADTLNNRVDLLMAEMDRTGAFARGSVVLALTTGTGWMNERNFQPAEYMLDGDTAVIGLQYSHLPSVLSFMSEQDIATDAARALIGALEGRLDALPESDRPQFLVTGESLGAFSGQSSFTNLADMLGRVDHALWVGTPGFTSMRKQIEAARNSGSRQMFPVIGDESQVVFAQDGRALLGTAPQIVYLQNADDPIAWWDPAMAFTSPDWISEKLEPSINPAISWGPVRTFLQVTIDTAVGNSFDEGSGHLYGTLPVVAWERMLRPGWNSVQIAALTAILSVPQDKV